MTNKVTTGLSEEDRKKYALQRDSFLELERMIISELRVSQEHLAVLTKRLEDNRPKTPNGEYMCETCKTISMVYNPTKSEMENATLGTEAARVFTAIGVYECEICGRAEKRSPGLDDYL
jgi:hypothetical protein